ncbi:Autophagy protein 5, partial [Oleoguttula sp. CCFEE 5521]
MPTLSSLQRQIWSGSLPLEIRLAPQDCRTYDDSFAYLVQVPRLSYLPFLISRLHAFFLPSLIDPTVLSTEGWLEFEGVPLKWHYPVGLLYDLYAGAEQGGADGNKEGRLPWRVTVHYSEFPDNQLWRQDLEGNTSKDSFNNAVKEADFLRNGSARTMMGMSKADQEDLWRSVTG